MNAASTTTGNATSAKRYALPRTRLSMFYLAGYLLPVGLALMFVPQPKMKLFLTNHAYDDLGLRMGGYFCLRSG